MPTSPFTAAGNPKKQFLGSLNNKSVNPLTALSQPNNINPLGTSKPGVVTGSPAINMSKMPSAPSYTPSNPSASSPKAQFINNVAQSQPSSAPAPYQNPDQRDTNGLLVNPEGATYDRNTGQKLGGNAPLGNPALNTTTAPANPFSEYVSYLNTQTANLSKYATPSKELADASTNLASLNSNIFGKQTSARHLFENTLDQSGGLKSGAQQAASMVERRSNAELADLSTQQNAAANSVNALRGLQQDNLAGAEKLFNAAKPLQIGDNYIDPKTGKILYEKPDSESGFTLSSGQTRYDTNGNPIASAGNADNADEVLSPTEATALGVPFGTTRGQAYGISPQKAPTEAQSKASGFAIRTDDANALINGLEDTISKFNPATFSAYSALEPSNIGNRFVPDEIRQSRQAERNFLNAILRRESGAVISPSEFANGEKQYFPRPGDDTKTLAQKKRNREVQMAALKSEAGNAFTNVNNNLNSSSSGSAGWF